MKVTLNPIEISVLMRQDAATKYGGGYQRLLVSFQEKLNHETGELELSEAHLDRISRYAFKYGNGGREDRLAAIFKRSLGVNLGKTAEAVAEMQMTKERVRVL